MDNFSLEITLDKAHSLYKEENLLIIDVRTAKEWKMTGVIPGSILISMHDDNNIERKSFLEEINLKISSYKNKKIAFICSSGSRSKVVMDFFLNEGYKNIYHIPDGIMGRQSDGWLFSGYPITQYMTVKEAK